LKEKRAAQLPWKSIACDEQADRRGTASFASTTQTTDATDGTDGLEG
jgi:hypothetical protein